MRPKGKALDERKAEIRIQFKQASGSHFMFGGQHAPCNELVMRLQPDQAIYFKVRPLPACLPACLPVCQCHARGNAVGNRAVCR